MNITRILILSGILLMLSAWLGFSEIRHRRKSTKPEVQFNPHPEKSNLFLKLQQKAEKAAKFTSEKGLNESVCFLLDMSIPSGQNRFFVYNLKTDSLQAAGLVAHGNCFEYWLQGRRYSNVVGSGCTSLGKYRIGYPYTGKFGYSYKLYGLDSSNNHAFERTVVLHAHTCIPDTESTEEICQSNGCPMVSTGFLGLIKNIINTSKKPVLLWIYE